VIMECELIRIRWLQGAVITNLTLDNTEKIIIYKNDGALGIFSLNHPSTPFHEKGIVSCLLVELE
jgi:hypothetical protein